MGVPQDARARRIEKKRRTKKLARWREQQAATPDTAAAPAKAPARAAKKQA
jgi:hypothetical protein